MGRIDHYGFSTEQLDINFKLNNKTERNYEIKTSFPTLEKTFWLKLINLRVSLDPPEAAIFAVNDPSAIGAMRALDEAGLRTGHDVALIGAGNIHYGAMLRVPLTTVSWSRSEMGRDAAQLLIELIEAKSPPARVEHVILEPELIIRDSCGARAVNKPTLRIASQQK